MEYRRGPIAREYRRARRCAADYDFLRNVDVRATGFSDSVFLETRLDDKRYSSVSALHNIFNFSINSLIAHLGMAASPFRGGVDIGYGVRVEEQLYSAATVRAVELEKCAKWPRVLIGKFCHEYLAQQARQPGPIGLTARKLLGLLIPDEGSGAYSIDFLGPESRRLFLGAAVPPSRIGNIWFFANQSYATFKNTDAVVAAYYESLIEYIRPRLEGWGIRSWP